MANTLLHKFVIILILAHIFIPSPSDLQCVKEEPHESRIINGYQVQQGSFPSVVAIYHRETQICGGTIISPNFVITAAHCVDEGTNFSVLAGTVDLREPGVRRQIANITVHPKYKYDYVSVQYDVAVVELDYSLPIIRRRIMYVKLPKFSTEIPQEWGTVLGWGDQEAERRVVKDSNLLMAVQLIPQECNTTDDFFCLGNPEGDKDSCFGDSGGPFIINRTLYGIISHGSKPSCASGSPGIYVKVPFMVKWIKKTAKIQRCIMCPDSSPDIVDDNEPISD